LEWLGFVWDLKIGSVEIPDRKMAHFKEKLNYVLKNPDRVIVRTQTLFSSFSTKPANFNLV
jgi:uncharacterized protein YbaP (TraB family)